MDMNTQSGLTSDTGVNSRWQTDFEKVGEEGNNLNLVQAVLGHKLILVACTLIGGGIGYYQFTETPPVFQSSARLRLIQSAQVIGVDGLNKILSTQDPIDTHIVLMRSPIILEKAVLNYGLENLPGLGGNPVGAISSSLSVRRSSESKEILDLSFKSSDPETCQKVLSGVIAAYIDYLNDSQQSASFQALQLITEAKDGLLTDLKELEQEYADFRENASLIWAGIDAQNIHTQRLGGIESKRSAVLLEKTLLSSQLESVKDLIKRGENREAILLMINQLSNENRNNSERNGISQNGSNPIAQHLMPLILEEQLLLEKLGQGHPRVREIQKKIELTRTLMESQVTPEGETEIDEKPSRPDILTVYTTSLENELEALDEQLVKLNQLFITEEIASRELSTEENRNRALKEDIARKKQLFETVLAQLQSAELTKETATLSAETIITPGRGFQIAPDLKKSVTMASAIGLLIGLGIAVLIEMSDRSYLTPSDIAKHLGAPVIGHIPSIDLAREKKLAKTPTPDPSLICFHRPNSGIAESYRNVRTALMMGVTGKHQIVQVTSANPSDGKTTLCANLALTIAGSGKKCLLMDCDFRRPRVHNVFGIENDIGITSIVQDGVELPDALKAGPIDNLDILVRGPSVKNPAELLLTPKFSELLELVRERYDVVIVDSPPLLAVSDPSTLATMADAVVLVMRITRNSRPQVNRVLDALKVVGANLIGTVVNATDGGDSKYGNNYNRYSPYGHGYPYNYSDKKYSSKYTSVYHDETPVNGAR